MTPASRSLLRAAADGDASLVRALLAQGTDVNSKTTAGQTPLMLASAFGHDAVVKLLMAAGADIELQDELGLSARDWAGKSPQIVELFFANPHPEASSDKQLQAQPPPTTTEADNEQTETVVFPRPRTFRRERADIQKSALPGLAGAILRDRTNPVEQPEGPQAIVGTIDGPIEPSETQSPAPVTAELPNEPPGEPVRPEPGNTVSASTWVSENGETADREVNIGWSANVESAEGDETTLSTKREPQLESESLTIGRTLIPRERVIVHEPRHPSMGTISRVSVGVPSFRALSERGLPRPIRWVLIIIFLIAGAIAGYYLSNYLLKRDTSETVTPASEPTVQPTPLTKKPGPIVGGALAGSELFLPDADYPITSSTGGVSGNVTVEVHVDQRGTVTSAKALDGDERLRTAAVEAARKAAFSPEKLKGKGRDIVGTVTYSFVAPQQQTAESAGLIRDRAWLMLFFAPR